MKKGFKHPLADKQKPQPKKPETFRERVEAQRNSVNEALQLFGDFPDCNPKHACEHDWMHVLLIRISDIAEQARFEVSDPEVGRPLLNHLAKLVAACEAWAAELEAE